MTKEDVMQKTEQMLHVVVQTMMDCNNHIMHGIDGWMDRMSDHILI